MSSTETIKRVALDRAPKDDEPCIEACKKERASFPSQNHGDAMSSIEKLFLESKGQPIEYKGKLIRMVDELFVEDGQRITVEFESRNSEWRQGISLKCDGLFEVNGHSIKKHLVLWADTAPPVVPITVRSKVGKLFVKNVWDNGDGVLNSWHNDAAMIAEDIPRGRRYVCNEGSGTDDFDDLTFTVTLG